MNLKSGDKVMVKKFGKPWMEGIVSKVNKSSAKVKIYLTPLLDDDSITKRFLLHRIGQIY